MRALILVVWLVIPVVAWAYHRGPGQERLVLDDAARLLESAEQYAATERWAEADAKYEAALALLPADRLEEARRVKLARAQAQIEGGQLPQAHQDLKTLVADLQGDAAVDRPLLADAQRTLANAQYYMTWLLRLEGEPETRWGPEIDAARQTLRRLAEQSESQGDRQATERDGEDLESAIRLARMDLHELQGLPLPSQ